MLEYDGSIHQLKCWPQEVLANEFFYIHLPNRMMKDVDGACHQIDPLIHRYLIDATTMYSNAILLRPFTYIFDVFSLCSNLRHVSQHDASLAIETVSTIPIPSVLYYYPIRFSSNLRSLPTTSNLSSLLGIVVLLNDIVWLSFNSVVRSFGSQLLSWPGSIVLHYMLETSALYFRIESYLYFHSSIHFTTLKHFVHHCSPLKFILAPRLRLCTYRVLRFFPGHHLLHS